MSYWKVIEDIEMLGGNSAILKSKAGTIQRIDYYFRDRLEKDGTQANVEMYPVRECLNGKLQYLKFSKSMLKALLSGIAD